MPHVASILNSRHIQAQDENGHTILYLIVEQRLEHLIEPLAEWIRQSSIPNVEGWMPLHQAVRNGDQLMAKAMIHAGSDISAQDHSGRTALHLAVHGDAIGIVQLLLDHGANPSAADYNGRTPLHEGYGQSITILQMLIKAGADIDPRQMQRGLTPLYYEAILNRESSARILLEAGADPSIQTSTGETVLQHATFRNHANIVRLLLEWGVDTTVRDEHGLTAVLVAAVSGADECLQLLLKAGADISVLDNYGRNALHIAAGCGEESTVRLLLKKGLDSSARDNRGYTPMCWAFDHEKKGVIQILQDAQKNRFARFMQRARIKR
ncbi:ankyrin repeat protein [Penicillium canariense]|uniref:Ankyrin repeat protein n=1 Tax=Penicillium canariense TaxID=189055 RepID=A0A9W9IMG7_9EURO|nr:ankyrin repeat protein [Penicillium canariense]KAJ5176966.1 ankyrin repeat protein [Penicillium canariense]